MFDPTPTQFIVFCLVSVAFMSWHMWRAQQFWSALKINTLHMQRLGNLLQGTCLGELQKADSIDKVLKELEDGTITGEEAFRQLSAEVRSMPYRADLRKRVDAIAASLKDAPLVVDEGRVMSPEEILEKMRSDT